MIIGPEPMIRTERIELSFGIFCLGYPDGWVEKTNSAKLREWRGFEGSPTDFFQAAPELFEGLGPGDLPVGKRVEIVEYIFMLQGHIGHHPFQFIR